MINLKTLSLALFVFAQFVAVGRAATTPDAKGKRLLASAIRSYHKLDLAEASAQFD